MFESNFPVDKMAVGYAALGNAFKRITAGASADEKLAIYSGTAKRVYRLGVVGARCLGTTIPAGAPATRSAPATY